MHQRAAFLGGGWARGGASEVVRRAHPASGAQWNVQVVRGKVNGKCLWNACKALSLGLLLMILGAAMATIGYYADHLSIAQEVRGNLTVRIKNESRGFHLNNLSYAGPIVMGVGGFIVVAACVMTFEARDSAAKVVPARLKLSADPPSGGSFGAHISHSCSHGGYSTHGSLKTSGSQTGGVQAGQKAERRALIESFASFSRGLQAHYCKKLNIPQGLKRSPSAPNLAVKGISPMVIKQNVKKRNCARKPFSNCALLNATMLQRHAVSFDESGATFRLSHESLQGSGSQGSLALDLHLECPVTLKVHDRRRNPLLRQRRVDEEERHHEDTSRRSSHSCSPRLSSYSRDSKGSTSRRSSNASDCPHQSRSKRRDYPHVKGRLERAISSDSRLVGARRSHRHHFYSPPQRSVEQDVPGGSSSDTDIRKSRATVHFYKI